MNDCYSAGSGAKVSLRVETTASSFFALPYHQLERVDFNSADGTDTVIVSFVTCTIRIIGKKLYVAATYIAKQEAESIKVTPKAGSPPSTDRLLHDTARIDKIEVVERKEQD